MLLYYSTSSQCLVFLSSLVVLFVGNLLELGQLFLREILRWGSNFPGDGQFFSGVIVQWQIVWRAIVQRRIFLRGNYPWGQLSSGSIVQEQLSGGAIMRGAIIRGPIFLGWNCLDTKILIYLFETFIITEEAVCSCFAK